MNKLGTAKKKSSGPFDGLFNNPEQDRRARESARFYTDAEIEELANQEPITNYITKSKLER